MFGGRLSRVLCFFRMASCGIMVVRSLSEFKAPDVFLGLQRLGRLVGRSGVINQRVAFVCTVGSSVFGSRREAGFFSFVAAMVPMVGPSGSGSGLGFTLGTGKYKGSSVDSRSLSRVTFFVRSVHVLAGVMGRCGRCHSGLYRTVSFRLGGAGLLKVVICGGCCPRSFTLLRQERKGVCGYVDDGSGFVPFTLGTVRRSRGTLSGGRRVFGRSMGLDGASLEQLFLFGF